MEPFLGQIMMFAGNFAPRGWAFCNGQLLPIAQNSALFSILGTTYGGNGTTTFALPDLRGRGPIHFGQGPGISNHNIGENGGRESVSLTVNQLPPHNHALAVSQDSGKVTDPAGNVLAISGTPVYSPEQPNHQMNPAAIGATGEGQPVPVMQPYLTINFVIALQGVYPSRE